MPVSIFATSTPAPLSPSSQTAGALINISPCCGTGGPIGRFGDLDWQLPGLKHAVHINGTINCPEVRDREWSVEFALPWQGLKSIAGGKSLPPKEGDMLRITAYRAHHYRRKDGEYHYKGWTWSIMGNDNIHIPERWTRVTFSNKKL